MKKTKKTSSQILMEVESKLRKTGITPNTLLYVSLYHTALTLQSTGKYKLSTDVCRALLKDLEVGDEYENKNDKEHLCLMAPSHLTGSISLTEVEQKELFARIPINNIKFDDSYEQHKFEEIVLVTPNKAISYLEQILHDLTISVSFNQECCETRNINDKK